MLFFARCPLLSGLESLEVWPILGKGYDIEPYIDGTFISVQALGLLVELYLAQRQDWLCLFGELQQVLVAFWPCFHPYLLCSMLAVGRHTGMDKAVSVDLLRVHAGFLVFLVDSSDVQSMILLANCSSVLLLRSCILVYFRER